jgi:hypothetical protein
LDLGPIGNDYGGWISDYEKYQPTCGPNATEKKPKKHKIKAARRAVFLVQLSCRGNIMETKGLY